MSAPLRPLLDPAPYTFRVGAVTALAPCMSVVLCLDETDDAGIQAFHDRSLDALGPLVTHYKAEQMTRRAPVTARARGMLATWLAKPTPGKSYYLEYAGCAEAEGVTAASWSLLLNRRSLASKPAAFREKWMASWRTMHARGQQTTRLPCTILRLTLPLDHALARPDALGPWIAALELVASGRFASGYAGYALNYFGDVVGDDVERPTHERLAATCLRHPGFDWFNAFYLVDRLLPFDPPADDFLPLVKRVHWLTLLSRRAVAHLGGVEHIAERLRAAPAVRVAPVADGVAIEAGLSPQLGDVATGDGIPEYRAIAAVVRPVRMAAASGPGRGFSDERAQEWLDAFDDGGRA